MFWLKFYVINKVLSGELSCTWTGLVLITPLNVRQGTVRQAVLYVNRSCFD